MIEVVIGEKTVVENVKPRFKRVKRKGQEYQYLDYASLPVLVLAVHPEYDERKFSADMAWRLIIHQTGGYACHQHSMIGLILRPRPEIVDKLKEIDAFWCFNKDYHATAPASLEEILIYREQLRKLGVDCNWSYPDFEEGIYPIDCSVEVVRQLALDQLPDDLDELIDWGDDPRMAAWNQLSGIIGRWNLYILGGNRD